MTFNWVISSLDSIPSLDGMDKVISVIHYRAQKQHKDFTADTYGALSVDAHTKLALLLMMRSLRKWSKDGLKLD